ncbi:MAG: glutathione S-transferase C-terminal domain-containing protein [Methylophilaceae bacterium]|nr:glutathione binding-like protein [Erythrobacter sp.]MDZ4098591.1 glutathione S-transferase C-terminal domain-containing protein [Methylophilaceae bacterium]MDZ4273626.1 glutathione S-transferase C-terminal domain-containing protein [Erythrobacter sp.]
MQLYYKTGACSLAARIALIEAEAPFDAVLVDTRAGLTEDGRDYRTINPKGYVPALELADGQVLTEGPAVLQFIADQHPAAGLAPPNGTLARARLQEHLNYISSELHKAFAPFFSGARLDASNRDKAVARVHAALASFERHLADGRTYLMGDAFTVADALFFVVVSWSKFVAIDLLPFPHIAGYMTRTRARSSVQKAMNDEGLAD